MRFSTARPICVMLMCCLALPAPAPATDVDGPDDCLHAPVDFGDAPEGIEAYLGVIGHFPTCIGATAAGTRESWCTPISSAPGMTGFVRHRTPALPPSGGFWLGCPTEGAGGIDSETDGKVNTTTGNPSVCDPTITVDCVEAAFDTSFGQDECYGSSDASLPSRIAFDPCTPSSVTFDMFVCPSPGLFLVYLNILVDWNMDGDWNDNFPCPGPTTPCAYEWAVKNYPMSLGSGCHTITSPSFLTSPNEGRGWMRITVSGDPAPDDFPWNGSVSLTGSEFRYGETEDYPVTNGTVVGVGGEPLPGELWLAPTVPNPARDDILVRYALPHEDDVSLTVYDTAGRKLAELARGRMPAGEHRVSWNFRGANGREISAGYYVVKLRVGDRVLTTPGVRVR